LFLPKIGKKEAMKLFLKLFSLHLPSSVKRNKLEDLFRLAADAFQTEIPEIQGLSYPEALERFATFTRDEAGKAIHSGDDLTALKGRLFTNAMELGENLRKKYRIKTVSDAMVMSRILYRILGIDFQGNKQGDVVIRRCFFSSFYSPQICEVISSLDEGVAAGLSDGGKFSFDQRMTEGEACCKARIRFEGNQP
jgi:hypothetical protein